MGRRDKTKLLNSWTSIVHLETVPRNRIGTGVGWVRVTSKGTEIRKTDGAGLVCLKKLGKPQEG